MLKVVIGLVLLAHGIGHTLGILQVFKVATVNPAWHGDSWLLTPIAGVTLAQALGVVLWTASVAGFAALGAVVIGWLPATWWQPVAVASSTASLAALVLFPTAFPTVSTAAAFVVDAAVLVSVAWLRWSPADLSA